MLIRFGLLAPLSLLSPKLRETVVAKYSGLQINPQFPPANGPTAISRATGFSRKRPPASGRSRCIAMAATGIIPLRDFAIFLGIASGVMFLNQVRTLVAHLWENDGEPMSVTAQYLDSVNVPPPATLAGAVGAGRPALSCAASPAARRALSYAGRGPPPHLARELAPDSHLFRVQPPRPVAAGRASRCEHDAALRPLIYSSCRIRTNSPISRNSRNGAQAARNGG